MRVVSSEGVCKIFHRHTGAKLIRHHLAGLWNRERTAEHDFYALRDVTFEVRDGESVGVIGSNGAGKSTLLSLVTGVAKPDRGRLEVRGRIAALLELGSGFHPDLTGAENLMLNAALLGFSRKQTFGLFDSIVEFAGVGEFIDEPLRTYSSGMAVRLAFAVAVNLNPDILIVDEVLAVGDQAFQAKCAEKIRELRRSGKTLLFVSHNAATVLELCDRALWLDHGELVMQGAAAGVVEAYRLQAEASRPELSPQAP